MLARWLVVALWLVPSAAAAQHTPTTHGRGSDRLPPYDVASEITVNGTIGDIQETTDRSSRTSPDVRFTLITDARVIDVRLAPSAFLTARNVALLQGARVEVTGSEVRTGTSATMLARVVRTENTEWSLRDEHGQPLWTASPASKRGFWTRNRVILLAALAGKVVAAVLLMG